jgi:hypothetical protein
MANGTAPCDKCGASESRAVLDARDDGWNVGVKWAADKGEKIIADLEAQNADLLAALEEIAAYGQPERAAHPWWRVAREAIARAKGGE